MSGGMTGGGDVMGDMRSARVACVGVSVGPNSDARRANGEGDAVGVRRRVAMSGDAMECRRTVN